MGMFLVSLVYAENIGTFEKNIEMQITNYCSTADCTYANLSSITYPNGTIIYFNEAMTQTENEFNYTYTPTEIGLYTFKTCSNPEGEDYCESDNFEVTNTGKDFSEGEGMVSVGILLGVLGLAFLFMFLGFKLTKNSKAMPIGFFFIVLSLILGIYSLNLGYAFTHDILQYESLSPVASTIYTSFLWLIIGIAVISMALMLISFIRELGKMSKRKKFGEDFNPITDTY